MNVGSIHVCMRFAIFKFAAKGSSARYFIKYFLRNFEIEFTMLLFLIIRVTVFIRHIDE